MSDLAATEFNLFLFGACHDKHYAAAVGTVWAIMNAEVLPPRDGSHALSLNDGDQLLRVGSARDYGICAGIVRKTGERCTLAINTYAQYSCCAALKGRVCECARVCVGW